MTGGAGFIGSHLVDRLLALPAGKGYEVVVLDDLSLGSLANIEQHVAEPRLRFLQASVEQREAVREAMQGCDLVFHLAAVVGVKHVIANLLATIRANVLGTHVVLEGAAELGCRVVLASSSEVYGKSAQLPLREDGDRVLGSPGVARWAYAASKALDEHLALAYARQGLRISVVRYFNAYGPRMDPRGYGSVVAKFIAQALRGEPLTVHGDGAQTRSFTYVADTIEGTLRAALREQALGEVINLGAQEEIAVMELAHRVLAACGSASPIVHVPPESLYGGSFEDPVRRVPDVAKTRRLLGFTPQTPLEEGLARTVAWARKAWAPASVAARALSAGEG